MLGADSFAGFGTALNTVDGGQDGILPTSKNAVLSALPLAEDDTDSVLMAFADPDSGAFTFEAIVRVDFDPSLDMAANGRNSPMQILSGDGDFNAERVFQWRLAPVGFGSGNTSVCRFEFINIRQGTGIQTIVVPIPDSGPDAIASNKWYHVAVTYDGNEGAPNNLKFYWTLLDTNRSVANLIGTGTMFNDLVAGAACDFAIGNEGRATGGSSDNFIGLIDEVRISSVARAPNEFVFRSVSVLEASSWQEPNVPANTLDGDLGTRWSAQGDGQWITYDLGRSERVESIDIAFYQGNIRTATFDVLLSNDNANWVTALANAVSSGTTLGLEPFILPEGMLARYVRIVGHGNSQSDWNSLTEVVIHSSVAEDSDSDGLPDFWETIHFGNLAQGADDDPDKDGASNIEEYNPLSTPEDTDADGLPDAWEKLYLGSLASGAEDDPDGDGFTNAEEFDAGTHPGNPVSNPGDTDGDGLPDAWELAHFGALDQSAEGDFDGDGHSNIAEYEAGTDPADDTSHPVTPILNYVPIEDGNPFTSEFGFAGASAINTVSFVRNALHTEKGQQFIAYYYRHATNASDPNNNRIVIARRNVGSRLWQVFFTPFTANNINDGHDVVSFGIDGAGYMHLSWGMHGDAFHYAKSTTPVFGTNAIVFGPDTTMTGNENSVTYPQWLRLPDGDLLYLFREGSSGNGDLYLNRYHVASQSWSNVHTSGSSQRPFIKGTGWNPNYNAYPNMPQVDADGNLHLVWTWRYQSDSPAGESGYQTNHDFDYGYSTNGGLTWLRPNGVPYALPISERGENGDPNTMAEKILAIPEGYSLINQAGMCLDQNNSPVIATWWAPGTATNNFRRQYMVVFRDEFGVWQVRQVSNRTNDPPEIKYSEASVRDLGRPVVVCDTAGRLIVLYRDNFISNGLTIVHSLPYAVDPQRTNWTTIDLTTDNLGNYEPVIDHARWELDNNLHIVYQPSAGLGYSPPANTAAEIGVLEWNAAAYFAHRPALDLELINDGQTALLSFASQVGWGYRVQTSTNLVDWTTLATLDGTGGQLESAHPASLEDGARYWRLEIREGGFAD